MVSLRKANIYEKPAYRHFLSGFAWKQVDAHRFEATCNYLVVNTSLRGETQIYQAGKYFDVIVRTPEGWRFASKRAVYDTSRVQTLLAFPI